MSLLSFDISTRPLFDTLNLRAANCYHENKIVLKITNCNILQIFICVKCLSLVIKGNTRKQLSYHCKWTSVWIIVTASSCSPPNQLCFFCIKMSSSHQYLQNSNSKTSTVVRLGDIEHQSQLSENLSTLCLSHEYSDITLVVEGQKLYAHKVINSTAALGIIITKKLLF